MNDDNIKVLFKVVDNTDNRVKWLHFCYINEKLYKRFLGKTRLKRAEIISYIILWAKADFNITLSLSTRKDMLILKELIKERYRKAYPHIFKNTKIDKQGWSRVWLTERIERELERYANH